MKRKQLMARFNTAQRRIKKEEKTVELAQARLRYWRRVALDLQHRYRLAKSGQLEFPGLDDSRGLTPPN